MKQPQSLSNVIIHAVFSTKHRSPMLAPATRGDLFPYMGGILRELKCNPILVGGVEDHVHCLIGQARTIPISQMIEELKTGSNRWLKGKGVTDFAWQAGYGTFSVSPGDLSAALRYVENQEEHHRRVSFQEEYRALMADVGVEIDERYAWD